MSRREEDEHWMRRALAYARRGLGTARPNPLVGAIVLDPLGREVGRGFHRRGGEPHAEAVALDRAGAAAKGGTLYVTLEPCCHQGRTPPCTRHILQSGVRRIVAAMKDPHPLVDGKGIAELRGAGLEVEVGCLEAAAAALNRPFLKAVRERRPLLTAKAAITLDAKMGVEGRRLSLSGRAAENTTMRLRAEAGAILVGVDTILTDNPRLNVRGRYADRKPVRAVVDPHLKTGPRARLFSTSGGQVWIFTGKKFAASRTGRKRRALLEKKGALVFPLGESRSGFLPPKGILDLFWRREITAVLLEGGAATFDPFARAGLIDRWCVYLVPRLLGARVRGRNTVPFPLDTFLSQQLESVTRRGADWELVATRKH